MADDFKAKGELKINSNIPEVQKELTSLDDALSGATINAEKLTEALTNLATIQNNNAVANYNKAYSQKTREVTKAAKIEEAQLRGWKPAGKKGQYTGSQLKKINLNEVQLKQVDEVVSQLMGQAPTINQSALKKVISSLSSGERGYEGKFTSKMSKRLEEIRAKMSGLVEEDLIKQYEDAYEDIVRELKTEKLKSEKIAPKGANGQYSKRQLNSTKLDEEQLAKARERAEVRTTKKEGVEAEKLLSSQERIVLHDLQAIKEFDEQFDKFIGEAKKVFGTKATRQLQELYKGTSKSLENVRLLQESKRMPKRTTPVPKKAGLPTTAQNSVSSSVENDLWLALNSRRRQGLATTPEQISKLRAHIAQDQGYKEVNPRARRSRRGKAYDTAWPVLTSRDFKSFIGDDGEIVAGTRVDKTTGKLISNKTIGVSVPDKSKLAVPQKFQKDLTEILGTSYTVDNLNNKSITALSKAFEYLSSVKDSSGNFDQDAQKLANTIVNVIESAYQNTMDETLRKKLEEILTGRKVLGDGSAFKYKATDANTPDGIARTRSVEDARKRAQQSSDDALKRIDMERRGVDNGGQVYNRKGLLYDVLRGSKVFAGETKRAPKMGAGDNWGDWDNQSTDASSSSYDTAQILQAEQSELNKMIDQVKLVNKIWAEKLDFFNSAEFGKMLKEAPDEAKEQFYMSMEALFADLPNLNIDQNKIWQSLNMSDPKIAGDAAREIYVGMSAGNAEINREALSLDTPVQIKGESTKDSYVDLLTTGKDGLSKIFGETDGLSFQNILNVIKQFGKFSSGDVRSSVQDFVKFFQDFVNSSNDLMPEDSKKLKTFLGNLSNFIETIPEGGDFGKKFRALLNNEVITQNSFGIEDLTDNVVGPASVDFLDRFNKSLQEKYGTTNQQPVAQESIAEGESKILSHQEALSDAMYKLEPSLDATDDSFERLRKAALSVAEILEKQGNTALAQEFRQIGTKGKTGGDSLAKAYNSLANLINFADNVDLSNARYVKGVNDFAGREVLSEADQMAQWRTTNPELAQKYDISKKLKGIFDANGGVRDIDKALEAVFNSNEQTIQWLVDFYNKLNYNIVSKVETVDSQGNKQIKEVTRTAQEMFREALYSRLDPTGTAINPDKFAGRKFYGSSGIRGEKLSGTPLEGYDLSHSQRSQLQYQAGYTGLRYGGNTVEERYQNAKEALEATKKKLIDATDEEKELLEAELKQIQADIRTLSNAKKKIKYKNKSKTTTTTATPTVQTDALAQLKDTLRANGVNVGGEIVSKFGRNEVGGVIKAINTSPDGDIRGTTVDLLKNDGSVKTYLLESLIKNLHSYVDPQMATAAQNVGKQVASATQQAGQQVASQVKSGSTYSPTTKSSSWRGIGVPIIGQGGGQQPPTTPPTGGSGTSNFDSGNITVNQGTVTVKQSNPTTIAATGDINVNGQNIQTTAQTAQVNPGQASAGLPFTFGGDEPTVDEVRGALTEAQIETLVRSIVAELKPYMEEKIDSSDDPDAPTDDYSNYSQSNHPYKRTGNYYEETQAIKSYVSFKNEEYKINREIYDLESKQQALEAKDNLTENEQKEIDLIKQQIQSRKDLIELLKNEINYKEIATGDGRTYARIDNMMISSNGMEEMNKALEEVRVRNEVKSADTTTKVSTREMSNADKAIDNYLKKYKQILAAQDKLYALQVKENALDDSKKGMYTREIEAQRQLVQSLKEGFAYYRDSADELEGMKLTTEQIKQLNQGVNTAQAQSQVSRASAYRQAQPKATVKATGMTSEDKTLANSYLNNYKQQLQLEREAQRAEQTANAATGQRRKEYEKLTQELKEQLAILRSNAPILDEQNRTIAGQQVSEEAINYVLKQRQALDQNHLIQQQKITAQAKQQKSLIQQIAEGFKASFRNLTDYSLAYQTIGYLRQMVSTFIQTTKEMDKNIVSLQIATGESYAEIYDMMKDFNSLGQEMGRTTSDVAQAADDWLRAGYAAEEANQLIEASMNLSTLGQIDSADATSYLISMLKGWKMEVEDVTQVVDRLTAVDILAKSVLSSETWKKNCIEMLENLYGCLCYNIMMKYA